jgi:hypothetical protein
MVGVEAIHGQVLQGFAGEGRGEGLFASMGGDGGIVPGLIKFGIGEVFGTVADEFVGCLESVKVVLVNFIAEVVF